MILSISGIVFQHDYRRADNDYTSSNAISFQFYHLPIKVCLEVILSCYDILHWQETEEGVAKIHTVAALDHERYSRLDFIIVAADGGNPRLSSQAYVHIFLTGTSARDESGS